MAKRVTIMLDNEVDKQLRNYQASAIKKTGESISFSKIINMLLEEKGIPKTFVVRKTIK